MHHSRVRHVDESVHPDPMDHVHLITAMYRHLQRQLDGGPYHSLLGGVQHLPMTRFPSERNLATGQTHGGWGKNKSR